MLLCKEVKYVVLEDIYRLLLKRLEAPIFYKDNCLYHFYVRTKDKLIKKHKTIFPIKKKQGKTLLGGKSDKREISRICTFNCNAMPSPLWHKL